MTFDSQIALLALLALGGCGSGADETADASLTDAAPLGPWQTATPIYAGDFQYQRDGMLSPDGRELYFSYIASSAEILRSTRADTDAPWSTAVAVPELNDPGGNFGQRITPDGLTLFFASDRIGGVETEIFTSTRADLDAAWEPPTLLPVFGSPADDRRASPCLGATRFVFESDRGGTPDLYELVGDQVTAIPGLDTDGREISPFITEDCLTLYFGSDVDFRFKIFVTERVSVDQPFGTPVPIEGLVDPSDDDNVYDPWLSADGRHLVFTLASAPFSYVYESFR